MRNLPQLSEKKRARISQNQTQNKISEPTHVRLTYLISLFRTLNKDTHVYYLITALSYFIQENKNHENIGSVIHEEEL